MAATLTSSRTRTRTSARSRVATAKSKAKTAVRGGLVGTRASVAREKSKLRRLRDRTRTTAARNGRVSRDARTLV